MDGSGDIYLTGVHTSSDFPFLNGFSISSGLVPTGFVTKLGAGGNTLLYSTSIGGWASTGYAIAADDAERVYISGETHDDSLSLEKAFQTDYGGNGDAFVAAIGSDEGLMR